MANQHQDTAQMTEAYEKLQAKYQALQEANSNLNERVLELYTLYNISRTLSTSFQVADMFEVVMGLIGEALNVDQYSLMFLDDERHKLLIKASHGMPEGLVVDGEISLEEGVAGKVIKTGKPLLVNDISHEKDFFYFPNSGIDKGSYLGVPLKNPEGLIMGVLNAHKPLINGFAQSDVRLFTAVAENVGIAINNAFTFQQTRELIRKDELTGLYNRRYFFERLEREVYRARRYDRTIALLMIDIDHFKEYNDTYGHLRGDQALKKIARLFVDILRKIDVVGRYGGEEFVVLLPETGKEEAIIVAEKLRNAVSLMDLNSDAANLDAHYLTITTGVSAIPVDANEPLLAIDLADKALYMGKAQGRNRVCAEIPSEAL
ncbi:MAG: sensor domain-containing diguanylate cyclase [Thermodesulfobacteriota bacterium]|nr:sensor domain-containing diguanylate cyclase [Thermodesulfobacteriota bacterium]